MLKYRGYAPRLALVLDRVNGEVSRGFGNTVNEDLPLVVLDNLLILQFHIRHEVSCHVTYMQQKCKD